MRITNPPAGHDSLDGVSTSDHHTKYSDADAASAVVEDAAYGAGWNADTTHAPSQNAVYDAIEALHAAPSDTAYAISWNGVTAIAPSKNAVYDKIEALHAAPSDTAYANTWDGVTAIAPSKNAVYDKIEALALGAEQLIVSVTADDDASITCGGLDTAVYNHFRVEMADIVPANNEVTIRMRLGDSGGIDSGSTDYMWNIYEQVSNGHTLSYDAEDGEIHLTGNGYVGNGTGEGYAGSCTINSGALHNYIPVTAKGVGRNGGNTIRHDATGQRLSGITLTQVQLLSSSGNITSGTMSVYGVRHT